MTQTPTFATGGFRMSLEGSLAFLGGMLLHKKSLGHPAKAENLKIGLHPKKPYIKLGLHPHTSTKPTRPRGGALRIRRCRGGGLDALPTRALVLE